jgi:pimeloyl-ACP methyl ester carboxylesterase
MPDLFGALWLNASPSLKRFHLPLLQGLAQQALVMDWEYCQHLDEANSLETALILLHDYLKARSRPIHLMGHGTGGLLGLLYARRYPARVRSLTLLSVGVQPAIDWQAHYFALRRLLPCTRQIILTQMVQTLFGYQDRHLIKDFVVRLEQDLDTSLSPHSLFKQTVIPPGGANIPMLVCGGQYDVIVDERQQQGWRDWLKSGDRLWQCPTGRHFFHYAHPDSVEKQILAFWHSVSSGSSQASDTCALTPY